MRRMETLRTTAANPTLSRQERAELAALWPVLEPDMALTVPELQKWFEEHFGVQLDWHTEPNEEDPQDVGSIGS